MKLRLLFAALFALGAGSGQCAPLPMGASEARHLLIRTGFGPTEAELLRYGAMSRNEAVEVLLREARTTAVTPPPVWALETGPVGVPNRDSASDQTRLAFVQTQGRNTLELRGWWVREMLVTPSPLTERMTLFWHNHFVSSQQKVRVARSMYNQNALLRSHALGNFGTMLHAVAKDPAMLIYLDGAQSRRGQPNENFAREVMELFTLGEGHYSEKDIKEAARAFTGWSVERETAQYRYRPLFHDGGVKAVLGKSGRFDGDDVLELLLGEPQTAVFITGKLWREFVSPEADAREVARIAQVFRGQRYEIKAVLRELLLSEAFWAPANRGTLVRSPVEMVVGTLRQFELEPAATVPFAIAAAGMGQNLLAPPNVKGWPGGEVWINSSTLLTRKQFLDRLVRASEMPGMNTAPMVAATRERETAASLAAPEDEQARARRAALMVERSMRSLDFDAVTWVAKRPGASAAAKMDAARALLLPLPPVTDRTAQADTDPLAFLRTTLLDPAYQLK